MNRDYFYVSKPRCASTHIYEGLTGWDDKINGSKPDYHVPAYQMQQKYGQKYTSSFKFSSVRSPYDLVVSWYHEHKKDKYEESVKAQYNLSFDEWVENGCPTHWNWCKFNPLKQKPWLYDDDKILVDFIVHLETFDEDMSYVQDKIGTKKDLLFTRRNQSECSYDLTEKQRKLIFSMFREDFECFGYTYNGQLRSDKEAYIMVAFGERYVQEAIHMYHSLRRFDKHRDFVLISDIKNTELQSKFVHVIDINFMLEGITNNHNRYCVYSRIYTPLFVPYARFILLDTDMLCMNDPQKMWDYFNNGKCFNCVGGRDGSKWHWGHIDEINKKLSMNMHPMHGGVTYFNVSNIQFPTFYRELEYALDNYDKLGFKRKFRNGAMTDEILFSYAMDKCNIHPHDFVNYPIVSFCLPLHCNISDKYVSWGTGKTSFKTSEKCIINHFTGLNEFPHIKSLYHGWIKKLHDYYIDMDNTVTCVTALYNIQREQNGDGRKWADYILWLKKTLELNTPMVIYCEQDTYNKIAQIRDRYPLTLFKIITYNDLCYLGKYTKQLYEIREKKTYQEKIKSKTRLEYVLPEYNLLIMNKFEWLYKAAKENLFNSDVFLWIDAGCSRFFDTINPVIKWPVKKLEPKFLHIQIKRAIESTEKEIMYGADHYTTATLFGGGLDVISNLYQLTDEVFHELLSYDCFNNEQIIMALIVKRLPNMFKCYVNDTCEHLPLFKYLAH